MPTLPMVPSKSATDSLVQAWRESITLTGARPVAKLVVTMLMIRALSCLW
jgi:hypothetical protein